MLTQLLHHFPQNVSVSQRQYKSIFWVIAIVYILVCGVYILLFPPSLVYEWQMIVPELSRSGSYTLSGNPSAFMPPLYPYYLVGVWKCVGGDISTSFWLSVSIVLQAGLYFMSITLLVRTFSHQTMYSLASVVCIAVIVFFPPILFGVVRNSAFALSSVLYIVVICSAYSYARTQKPISAVGFIVASILALYVRWDFVVYFLILSSMIIRVQRRKIWWYLLPIIFLVLCYAPWSIRNKSMIGTYSFNTATAFNIAKGNSISYNVLKFRNHPYDENRKQYADIVSLTERFANESHRDTYLYSIVREYIEKHSEHFLAINVAKIGITITQFFPESFARNDEDITSLRSLVLASVYSAFFLVFTIRLFLLLWRYGFRHIHSSDVHHFYFQFIVFCFVSHCIINSLLAPPLPRYILFYLPFFVTFITFTSRQFELPNEKTVL